MAYLWESFQPLPYQEAKSKSQWSTQWDKPLEDATTAWKEAVDARDNYLGGRTIGSQAEFVGWQDLSNKVDWAQRDVDALTSYQSQEAAGSTGAWYPDWWDGEKASPGPTLTKEQQGWLLPTADQIPPGAPSPEPEKPIIDTSKFTESQLAQYNESSEVYKEHLDSAKNIYGSADELSERTPFRGVRIANWHDVDRGNVAQGVQSLTNRSGMRISEKETGVPASLSGWDNVLNLLPQESQDKITSSPDWKNRTEGLGNKLWKTLKPYKNNINTNSLTSNLTIPDEWKTQLLN
tara:strand:- start:2900 stop:3775 length:876 start_codon:yes stop_codon:yes gene_type:complete